MTDSWDSEDWISDDDVRESRKTLTLRWATTGVLFISMLHLAMIAMVQLQAGESLKALFLQTLSVSVFFFALYQIRHTMSYKREMDRLIDTQEYRVMNDTIRMLAQIEVKLAEGENND